MRVGTLRKSSFKIKPFLSRVVAVDNAGDKGFINVIEEFGQTHIISHLRFLKINHIFISFP